MIGFLELTDAAIEDLLKGLDKLDSEKATYVNGKLVSGRSNTEVEASRREWVRAWGQLLLVRAAADAAVSTDGGAP